MDHPITWGEVLTVIIDIWLGSWVLGVFLRVVGSLIVHRQDMKTEDNETREDADPYAGKTLGL